MNNLKRIMDLVLVILVLITIILNIKKKYIVFILKLNIIYIYCFVLIQSDKLSKTREYAQQIEARNKKKLADAPRRALSETRKPPPEPSTTQRVINNLHHLIKFSSLLLGTGICSCIHSS